MARSTAGIAKYLTADYKLARKGLPKPKRTYRAAANRKEDGVRSA